MNALKAIRAKIIGDAAVAAIIGEKCYPVIAPQKAAVPFVIVSIVNVDPNDSKSGVSEVDVFRVQVDSYASTYDVCQDLDKKVRTSIDKFMGESSSIYVDGVRYINSQDLYEDESGEYRRSSDYVVRIK